MNFKALTSKTISFVCIVAFGLVALVLFTSLARAHPKKIKSVGVYEVTICCNGTNKIKNIVNFTIKGEPS